LLASDPARSVHGWAGSASRQAREDTVIRLRCTQRRAGSIAAWIWAPERPQGRLHLRDGGRTSAEIEGFVLSLTAAVLMVGAILSYGLVRLRAELRTATPPR
jgi:hypothetical protein